MKKEVIGIVILLFVFLLARILLHYFYPIDYSSREIKHLTFIDSLDIRLKADDYYLFIHGLKIEIEGKTKEDVIVMFCNDPKKPKYIDTVKAGNIKFLYNND